MHKFIPLILSCTAYAAQTCNPTSPVPCNRDTCEPIFCLGPATTQANAPVRPYTCDGDFVVTASALYWKAQLDGLEYGYYDDTLITSTVIQVEARPLINLIYLSPKSQYKWGAQFGVGYYSPCDGWDLSLNWTSFRGKATDENRDVDRNIIENIRHLFPLWSAFQQLHQGDLYASQLIADWNVQLNDIRFGLGREMWVSKYLSLRPVLGLEYLQIKQKYDLSFFGGSWFNLGYDSPDRYYGLAKIDQGFQGPGIFAGLDTNWKFGCGWSVFGDFSAGIIYGRFKIDHDETLNQAQSPFTKSKVLDTTESFHCSRGLISANLGIEYATLVCDCQYGINIRLSWEQHLYFHQNQMWRVVRNMGTEENYPPNNTGENDFTQSRGTLSTGGLTLKVAFAF